MATQLLDVLIAGRCTNNEILSFLKTNDCTHLKEKFKISNISSSEFIYSFVTYLRDQSSNILENAPRTSVLLAQRKDGRTIQEETAKEPVKTTGTRAAFPQKSVPSLDFTATLNQDKGSRSSDSGPAASPKAFPAAFSLNREEFPVLGHSSKEDELGGARIILPSKETRLQSTPLRPIKGNLDFVTPTDISEKIFSRKVRPGSRSSAGPKRALLTTHPREPNPSEGTPISSKKRVQLKPAPPWQGSPVPQNFNIIPEINQTPNEATKKQKELARTMKQEAVTPFVEMIFDSPSLETVTHAATLDCIAHLYADCLLHNLVPNLLLELHFVLELLVVKMQSAFAQPSLLLGTVSNCGYFAVQVLQHCCPILAIVEPSTLQLVKQLPHVQSMSTELIFRLEELCNQQRNFSMFKCSFIQGVSFDASLDNADNFPTQHLFGAFRRQRDLFYELLRDWQEVNFGYHKNELRFTNRVRAIFEVSTDPCNLLHLAQLFTRQLIASCCGGLETDESGITCEKVLQDLRNRSPDKFSKLAGRLEQPAFSGLSTRYQFIGHQAFFHSFIIEANYAQFHIHLKTILVDRIREDDIEYISPEDTETSVDSQVREEIFTHLYRLRLYGAFLGLIEFLPYMTSVTVGSHVEEQQRIFREKVPPLINLGERLQSSIQEKRLLFTMSWMPPYLSLADEGVTGLSTYEETWKLLSAVFRSCTALDLYSILLRILIGWIFHNLNISISFSGPTVDISLRAGLGEHIDAQILYMLCPSLSDLRFVVANYFCLNPVEVRKIAPVSAPESNAQASALETKLEEAFFFVNPPCVKRVVTFVSERVPSIVVRAKKEELASQFREEVKSSLRQAKDSGELLTMRLMQTLAQNLCTRLQLKAENLLLPICDQRLGRFLDELLDVDCGPDGIFVAKRICSKQCQTRVLQWIRCHISKEYLLDLIKECSKETNTDTFLDEKTLEAKCVDKHKNCESVGRVIDSLQDLLKELLAGNLPDSTEQVLKNTGQSLLHRRDWMKQSWEVVENILLDIGVMSIIRARSNVFTKLIISIFDETGLCPEYTVGTARNRYIINNILGGCDESCERLLAEYQLLIDKPRHAVEESTAS